MAKKEMKVVKVSPYKTPEVITMDGTLRGYQDAVGGYIEVLYPFTKKVGIICNEEGKLIPLEWNRALLTEDGIIYDVIFGDFLVVGLSSTDFRSLTDKEIDWIISQFSYDWVLTDCKV